MQFPRLAIAVGATALAASTLAFAPATTADESACTTLETVDVTAADGTVTSDDVLACSYASYLSGCDAAAGGKVWNQVVNGTVPLSFDAPTESFTAGAGCGTHEEPLFYGTTPGNPFYDLTIEGYVQGNIDELAVELHDIYISDSRATGEMVLDVRVEVDGESVFGSETVTSVGGEDAQTPSIISVPVTPEVSSTGLSEALRFSVGDLYELHGIAGKVGDGADAYHNVRVTISFPPGAHVAVWGATEIPSQVMINQGTPGTVLQYGTGTVIS